MNSLSVFLGDKRGVSCVETRTVQGTSMATTFVPGTLPREKALSGHSLSVPLPRTSVRQDAILPTDPKGPGKHKRGIDTGGYVGRGEKGSSGAFFDAAVAF